MACIRVLLAEDHTIVRKGLLSILTGEPDIEIVGEATDGREAVEMAVRLAPDVVVMDITMPHLSGVEATRQIKRRAPQVKILVLTMHTTEEYVAGLLRAGAAGYVVKQAAPRELLLALRAVYDGDMFLSPIVSGAVLQSYLGQQEDGPPDGYDSLTEREREVLQLLAEGYANRDIADLLVVSIKTVQTHRANVMAKLGLHSIPDLVKYAISHGIITVDLPPSDARS